MNRQTSPRFVILLLGGVAGLVIAVIAGSPTLAVLAAPAIALTTIAALFHRWPDLELSLEAPIRGVEGDTINLVVTAESKIGIPWLALEFELPPDLEPVDGIRRAVVSVPAGKQVVVNFPVELTQWGVSLPGRLLPLYKNHLPPERPTQRHQPLIQYPSAEKRRIGREGI